jgi:hypothetical protein
MFFSVTNLDTKPLKLVIVIAVTVESPSFGHFGLSMPTAEPDPEPQRHLLSISDTHMFNLIAMRA